MKTRPMKPEDRLPLMRGELMLVYRGRKGEPSLVTEVRRDASGTGNGPCQGTASLAGVRRF